MKPIQRGRFNNGRHNGASSNSSRGSRPQVIFRNTSLESTGPCGKLRGTALQLHEKYLSAAKDAQIQNDDILAETCLQYADHFMHIQNQAIANEQALHAQQIQNRIAQTEKAIAEEGVFAPSPAEAEQAPSETVSDSTLKVVDLSVPVSAMNKTTEPEPTPESSVESRHILRPRRVLKVKTQGTE